MSCCVEAAPWPVRRITPHACFNFVATDGEVVVAASLITGAEAAETMLAGHDEARAADTAPRNPAQQKASDVATGACPPMLKFGPTGVQRRAVVGMGVDGFGAGPDPPRRAIRCGVRDLVDHSRDAARQRGTQQLLSMGRVADRLV
jgi:hypothetical protein